MLKQIDSSETTAGGSGWWVEAEANRARHDWRMRGRTDQRRHPKKKEWASASGQGRTAAELPGIARTPPALGTHPARVCRLPDESAAAMAYRRPPGQWGSLLEVRRR